MSAPFFRVEVSDGGGQIVAIETQSLAGRDIGAVESKAICNAIDHLNGFIGANYADLTCRLDPLNPCWGGRRGDRPGKHWAFGAACPECCARASFDRASWDELESHIRPPLSPDDKLRAWAEVEQEGREKAEEERADLREQVSGLCSALESINTMACYASEEDTQSRAKVLLMIGEAARVAVAKARGQA